MQEIQEETKESVSTQKKLAGDSIGTATAISLGSIYNGSITSSNTKDFYKFTLSSSGRITISANASMNRIYYKIYDSSGEELWSINPYWNSTTGMSSSSETVDLTKGTYYFSVSKDGHNTGNYNFKMDFSSAGESFSETGNGSNNSMPYANSIVLNRSYKGQLAKNDDRDFYKLTLSSSRKVTLTATSRISWRIDYNIFNGNGQEVWSHREYNHNDDGISHISKSVNLSRGTYYFSVSSGGDTGNYSFKLSTHSHSYKNVVSKATPSRNGKIVKKCSCGTTNGTSVIYAPKKMSVSASKYTYNGKVRTPSVVVKDSKGRTSLTVKWKKKSSQTSGYQVQYSTNSKFKKGNKTVTIKSNKSSVKKITKLKAKKKYYVRVRTYKNVKISGKTVKLYSGWSKAKAVRTK